MRCDQRWTGWDLLIAVLIALIVVGDMMLAVKIVEVSIEDAEVQAVMEEAQKRIDVYYASLPARERPAKSGELRVESEELSVEKVTSESESEEKNVESEARNAESEEWKVESQERKVESQERKVESKERKVKSGESVGADMIRPCIESGEAAGAEDGVDISVPPRALEAGEPDAPVEDWYIAALPLDKQLQRTAFDAACGQGVDYYLLLAVMQVESGYDCAAVSRCGCYGLMQLNPQYFPSGLGDEDNIRAGAAYLADLLEQYKGDEAVALRAYNHGYDDGDRGYSRAVQEAREEIAVLSGQVMGP